MNATEHKIKTVFALPEGTHTVALGFGDLNGIMRGKRIPAQHWKTDCEDGVGIITAMFAMDMTCDIWETPYCNMDNGYPDMHMFPIAAPVACPWEPGVAICLAYTESKDHLPIPIDPRNALVRQVERAKAMGFDALVGTELKFYLLDPVTKLPKQTEIDVYGINRSAELDHVLGPIRNHLTAIGIPIEQSNPEYAPGQVEVNMRYDHALIGADRVILFRNMIKDIARREGYHATFMAKPFIDRSGSGFPYPLFAVERRQECLCQGRQAERIGLFLPCRSASAYGRDVDCRINHPQRLPSQAAGYVLPGQYGLGV